MTRLALLAHDGADVPALSALLQDAILRVEDVAFDARAHRLVLLFSRYRWEDQRPSRVRSALRIEAALAVSRRNWPEAADALLSLLALNWTGVHLLLEFSDGISLRASCETLDLVLEDLSEPWPVSRQPRHEV